MRHPENVPRLRYPAAQQCSCHARMRDNPFPCLQASLNASERCLGVHPWRGLGSAGCSPGIVLWAAAVISLSAPLWQPPHWPAKGLVRGPAGMLAQQKEWPFLAVVLKIMLPA